MFIKIKFLLKHLDEKKSLIAVVVIVVKVVVVVVKVVVKVVVLEVVISCSHVDPVKPGWQEQKASNIDNLMQNAPNYIKL
jgi:hypothetical protein